MKTLNQLAASAGSVPQITSWYLADLGEARGKQELYARQTPQRLKVLREHALIESAVSSNRIEGVTVDRARIGTLVFGRPILRDRDEEEIRGYRDALKWIHEKGAGIALDEKTTRRLHALSRGETGDAGKYKTRDNDIIEKFPDGGQRVRFKTVEASKTRAAMGAMLDSYHERLEERRVHPLILIGALNLDFLCVHPFRDGNGRASRLLWLLQAYHLGFTVGRYVSLERLIEQNKERYYETLYISSQGWHEGRHDPWPYINYVLYIMKAAYKEFEGRVGEVTEPKGAKAEMVLQAIQGQGAEFRLSDIERLCPTVGRDWIRVLLADLKKDGKVGCRGKGPAARWFLKKNGKKR